MDRIDSHLERLQPVAINHALECERVTVGRDEAVEMRKRRRLDGAEIGEQDTVLLHHRIRFLLDVGAEIAVVGFGRRLEASAVDIEQPAVKRAPQPAIFETAIYEVGPAMRAAAADQSV